MMGKLTFEVDGIACEIFLLENEDDEVLEDGDDLFQEIVIQEVLLLPFQILGESQKNRNGRLDVIDLPAFLRGDLLEEEREMHPLMLVPARHPQ